ncbi:MAG: PQQ-like beta-propeller repeat protein [Clostridia bacterium]|nr:PQQ-like beta-propeller repeat protein [Clostridia bacterium]
MSPFQLALNKIISLLFAAVLLPLTLLTHGLDLIPTGERPEEAKTNIVGLGAYFRSQGITTDGETFYFSSKTTLIRTESDAKTLVNANYSAIPDELSESYGIAHIGGLSYYDGKIYAGLEDSKVWDYPIVGVYDAETLELIDYYILDDEAVTRGLPWVCVDGKTGLLYCTDHSKNPTKLLVYDTANKMAFVKEVALESSPYAIQGAEIYDGIIYAATNDDTQAVYMINPESGDVEKLFDRNLIAPSEGEGMTVMIKDGKPVIAAMDMGPLFINAFVREYSLGGNNE